MIPATPRNSAAARNGKWHGYTSNGIARCRTDNDEQTVCNPTNVFGAGRVIVHPSPEPFIREDSMNQNKELTSILAQTAKNKRGRLHRREDYRDFIEYSALNISVQTELVDQER